MSRVRSPSPALSWITGSLSSGGDWRGWRRRRRWASAGFASRCSNRGRGGAGGPARSSIRRPAKRSTTASTSTSAAGRISSISAGRSASTRTSSAKTTLTFIGPDGRASRSAAGRSCRLRCTFFRRCRGCAYLSCDRKWQLARGLRQLARHRPARCGDESFLHWLERHGQSPAVIERFWHVVLVSALSETLDRIDVSPTRERCSSMPFSPIAGAGKSGCRPCRSMSCTARGSNSGWRPKRDVPTAKRRETRC